MITTYSMWNAFRNCKRKYQYRYKNCLVPIKKDANLNFGSIVHEALADYYTGVDKDTVLKNAEYKTSQLETIEKRFSLLEMIFGYMERYASDNWNIEKVEEKFEIEILPDLKLSGKVDLIINGNDGAYYLVEHKTASSIANGYLDKLWTDLQIILYYYAIEKHLGIKIDAVIYNILLKSKIRVKQNETNDEFIRRLSKIYSNPDMFYREKIIISRDDIDRSLDDIIAFHNELKGCEVNDGFYPRNTSYCFEYFRPCEYWPICRGNENKILIDNYYRIEEPHIELK